MILKQYYLGCLAHASYLLDEEASSTAIIFDRNLTGAVTNVLCKHFLTLRKVLNEGMKRRLILHVSSNPVLFKVSE